MLDPQPIKKEINKRFEAILHRAPSGLLKPYVCLVCDEFLKPTEVHTISVSELKEVRDILIPSSWNAIPGRIARQYRYLGDIGDDGNNHNLEWISNMLLSPRGCSTLR